MRRWERERNPRLFRGGELPRLMTMILMMGVIFMLMGRVKDPKTWKWLADDGTAIAVADPQETATTAPTAQVPSSERDLPEAVTKSVPATAPLPAESETEPANSPEPTPDNGTVGAASTSVPAGVPSAAPRPPTEPTGPTDQDEDEASAAEEEFQAILDGSLQTQPEEMQAYHRVVRWVNHQSVEVLRRRAKKALIYSQYTREPEKRRGQIFELELNVRRILKCDELTPDGLQLYEIWGFTDDSKGWMYVGVVVDLPPGMPIGPEVEAEARLVGYFFKLQGYQPGGAGPRDRALAAPMLIGRLIWKRMEAQPAQASTDWFWGIVIFGGIVFFALVRVLLMVRGQTRRRSVPTAALAHPGPTDVSIEDWLDEVDPEEAAAGRAYLVDEAGEGRSDGPDPDEADSDDWPGGGGGGPSPRPPDWGQPGGGVTPYNAATRKNGVEGNNARDSVGIGWSEERRPNYEGL